MALLGLTAAACVAFGARGLATSYYGTRTGVDRVDALRSATMLAPDDWRYRLELASFLQAVGDSAGAIETYRRAIAVYRGCAACWIGLAEAQAASGADPTTALEEAIRYGHGETSIRLRAGALYARLGRHENAGREFTYAQRGMGDQRNDLYALLHRVYDVRFLLDHVIEPADVGLYFSFVRQNRPLSEARVVWERYRDTNADRGAGQRGAYAKLLLENGMVGEAWDVRFHDPPRARDLLDGDFESDTDARPFGWHLSSKDGVAARIVACDDCPDHGRALRLSFDGKSNPRYAGVWQDIPVDPGAAYVVKARVRAAHVTSASGPRLAVRGLGPDASCDLWASSEPWTLTTPWSVAALAFEVPAGCTGVRFMVMRTPTDQLSKFLGGELWIDDVELRRRDTASAAAANAGEQTGRE